MNITYCTSVPLAGLLAEMRAIPLVRIQDGSGHSHFGGPHGWIRGLSNSRIRLGETYPLITEAVEELQDKEGLSSVVQVMVNNLAPGASLSPHRDGLPDNLRYHLPILTNTEAYWWDELESRRHMLAGWWYGPVPYCGILHSAGNPGTSDRLHLVVDFKRDRSRKG